MMQRIEDLREPAIIGKFYLVPTVHYTYIGIKARWPVIGPLHNDKKFLNFDHLHYHVDARFITEHQWARLSRIAEPYDAFSLVTRAPLCENDWSREYKDGKPQAKRHPHPFWAVKRCARQWAPYPHSEAATVSALHDSFKDQFAIKKDGEWLCPHRQVGLGSMVPDDDGFVTCPLHGLRIDCTTGQIAQGESGHG